MHKNNTPNFLARLLAVSLLLLLLTGCGWNLFSPTLSEESGTLGYASDQLTRAQHYYVQKGEKGWENAKIILNNLIEKRWDKLEEREKVKAVMLYSLILFNEVDSIKNQNFLSSLRDTLRNIIAETFNTDKVKSTFINTYPQLRQEVNQKIIPLIERLYPHSGAMSEGDFSSVVSFVSAALGLQFYFFTREGNSTLGIGNLTTVYGLLKTLGEQTAAGEDTTLAKEAVSNNFFRIDNERGAENGSSERYLRGMVAPLQKQTAVLEELGTKANSSFAKTLMTLSAGIRRVVSDFNNGFKAL